MGSLRALEAARQRAWRADVSAETRATPEDVSGETRTTPSSNGAHEPRTPLARADALVAVAEAYLRGDADAAPVELVVHVDEAALREDRPQADPDDARAALGDGTPSPSPPRSASHATTVVRMTEDASGNVRPLGRRTRRIPTSLRRALRVRDTNACRFPGCTNRITDAHHLVAWSRGGATTLANLCSLCRRHHRVVHEHGYRIERTEDGALCFIRADGSLLPEADTRPAPLPLDAFERLRDLHSGQGLGIDAMTAFPRWDGEPADYDLIVEGLIDQPAYPLAGAARYLKLPLATLRFWVGAPLPAAWRVELFHQLLSIASTYSGQL